ncbi:hypothetical protein GUJ93_ZPchr0005g15146 [Zizania palustris]|uniref:CAP-Gly domain-containing protein n=1 Tax=Zizania palustris TaxID=103762 RepID=A0A8J5SLP7_ZIZPA|nr:hypothetical protein GUJ93_ZPchr0005g15146 [Zizania palustris]
MCCWDALTSAGKTWRPSPSPWASACTPPAILPASALCDTWAPSKATLGSGDWVGVVDWDAGAGGRHDGSLAGRRYFHAAGERSASFARPTALSAGITLPNALRNRYRVDDFTEEEEDEMYVFSTSQKRVSVELVGKKQEKLKNFNELISASVSCMGVTSTGPVNELKNLVPSNYCLLILSLSLACSFCNPAILSKLLDRLCWYCCLP